ncbi:MAG: LytTR family DNA-binding domain-containing protein [Bacteroidota bacterium]
MPKAAQLRQFLRAPFPKPERTRKQLAWLTLVGLLCFVFILLFQPFGIRNVNGQWYYNLLLFTMGVLFVGSIWFMEWLVPWWFPKLFERWTIGKATLWYSLVVLVVGSAMFFYKSFLGGFSDFTGLEFLRFNGRLLLLGATVSFFVLGIHHYLNKRSLSMASINASYTIQPQYGDPIQVDLKDILFIQSDDNYIDLHVEQKGQRNKLILRSSLKSIETQIVNAVSPIQRCHRQYLINIDRFEIAKKTSRSMTLKLKGYEDELPVSQQYVPVIAELLVEKV